jgi:hypothetical protein
MRSPDVNSVALVSYAAPVGLKKYSGEILLIDN